jgi:hypothetical protein
MSDEDEERALRLLAGNLQAASEELLAANVKARAGLLDANSRAKFEVWLTEVAEAAAHVDVCAEAARTLLEARLAGNGPATVVPFTRPRLRDPGDDDG